MFILPEGVNSYTKHLAYNSLLFNANVFLFQSKVTLCSHEETGARHQQDSRKLTSPSYDATDSVHISTHFYLNKELHAERLNQAFLQSNCRGTFSFRFSPLIHIQGGSGSINNPRGSSACSQTHQWLTVNCCTDLLCKNTVYSCASQLLRSSRSEQYVKKKKKKCKKIYSCNNLMSRLCPSETPWAWNLLKSYVKPRESLNVSKSRMRNRTTYGLDFLKGHLTRFQLWCSACNLYSVLLYLLLYVCALDVLARSLLEKRFLISQGPTQ